MALKHLKQEKGFTIIEVLIVLAIAGLIMLVVFLAVPALQRNSRNTQRKNDISQIVGALQEYVNNNAGKVPATDAIFQSDALTNAKPGFYTNAGDVVYAKNSAAFTSSSSLTDNSKVYVETYAKCDGNDVATTGASSRNVVAIYFVEASSGNLKQCQDM